MNQGICSICKLDYSNHNMMIHPFTEDKNIAENKRKEYIKSLPRNGTFHACGFPVKNHHIINCGNCPILE
jgi:hypothetical protein